MLYLPNCHFLKSFSITFIPTNSSAVFQTFIKDFQKLYTPFNTQKPQVVIHSFAQFLTNEFNIKKYRVWCVFQVVNKIMNMMNITQEDNKYEEKEREIPFFSILIL